MSRTISESLADLWKFADSIGVAGIYTTNTRNKDPEIRAAFKAEKEIAGTKAWAVTKCMSIPNSNYSDEECAQIKSALSD